MNNKMKQAILFVSILFLVVLALHYGIPSDHRYYEKINNHAYDLISLLAVITAYMTFRVFGIRSKEGKVWFALFIGLLLWLVADVGWTINVYLGRDTFPSLSDVFYILGYLGVILALVLEYSTLKDVTSRKSKIIAGILTVALAVVMCVWVIVPMLLSEETPVLEKAISTLYPAADLVIIFFSVIIVLAFGVAKASRFWLMIGLGLLLWSVADTINSYLEWKGIEAAYYLGITPVWIAGLLLVALGAYYHSLIMKGEA